MDLLLIDIDLLNMSLYEKLREIANEERLFATPIILLTSR